MKLSECEPSREYLIVSLNCSNKTLSYLSSLGIIPGNKIKVIRKSPFNDPIEIEIFDYNLCIRGNLADLITVESTKEGCTVSAVKNISSKTFYRNKEKNDIVTFALVGNQNCGKTTLFNALTGSNQHVGNFPGVTVDRKDGIIKGYKDTLITDFPGIYSLVPFSSEEKVTSDFLLYESADCIINIVDATNLERNLFLTLQLKNIDIPMVVAVNMIDEMKKKKISIDFKLLSVYLGCPVVPISASKGIGVKELTKVAYNAACEGVYSKIKTEYSEESVEYMIDKRLNTLYSYFATYPVPVLAAETAASMNRYDKNYNLLNDGLKNEFGMSVGASVSYLRYKTVFYITEKAVEKSKRAGNGISGIADRVLCNKYTAMPIFFGVLLLVFYISFGIVGKTLTDVFESILNSGISSVESILHSLNVNNAVISFVSDGILNGISSVIVFLPMITVLFFLLSMIEDSGYMARITFICDNPMQKLGLSGKSVVPLLLGYGCTVPAIMSSRTLADKVSRKKTIFLLPFISCSAKLPVYMYICNGIFETNYLIIIIALYAFGAFIGVLGAYLLKSDNSESVFIIELPKYRMPTIKNTLRLVYEKAKDFISRAFTIIFIANVAIWFLSNFSFNLQMVSENNKSILETLSIVLVPVFKPIGLGDWHIITALLSGFAAKESIVSTLTVTNPLGLSSLLSKSGAVSMLVFTLLYTPCVAAVSTIKRELGAKYCIIIALLQFGIAWVFSFIIFNIIRLIV